MVERRVRVCGESGHLRRVVLPPFEPGLSLPRNPPGGGLRDRADDPFHRRQRRHTPRTFACPLLEGAAV